MFALSITYKITKKNKGAQQQQQEEEEEEEERERGVGDSQECFFDRYHSFDQLLSRTLERSPYAQKLRQTVRLPAGLALNVI